MERRLAAILAADVVGYSRLMGEDEARTLAALKAHRKELIVPKEAQYHGRTIKLMGDGVLMEFGSVVDAVGFAVEIQLAMRERNASVPEDQQIVYRVGINVGDIIVEDDDIFGDGVNVAARLEGLSEAGGICAARNVFDQVKDKLDLTFELMGEKEVKNIAEPVAVYRVVFDEKAEAFVTPVVQGAAKQPRHRLTIAIAAVALLLALGGVIWWLPLALDKEPAGIEKMSLPLSDKPSIAVLPFENLSDDPEQEYFADGMTEDLITDLSKVSGLFVIARNSSFAYKGKSIDLRQVGRELGVRNILEGSVRRVGERIRINVQLIDTSTGGHKWAERYDGEFSDIFDLQDQVMQSVIRELAVRLTPSDELRQTERRTIDPEAHDAFLRGWAHYVRSSAADYAAAIPHLEEALRFDPAYGRAHAALASIYQIARIRGWQAHLGLTPDDTLERAIEHLESAKNHPSPLAHQVASSFLTQQGHHDQAILEADTAIALDTNDPAGYFAKARALVFAGRHDEAATFIDKAKRLNPYYPADYVFYTGVVEFGQERYEAATVSLENAHKLARDNPGVLMFLIASYGYLDRTDDADAMMKKFRDLASTRSMEWTFSATVLDVNVWRFKRPEDSERLRAGLRRAGLPEFEAEWDLVRDSRLSGERIRLLLFDHMIRGHHPVSKIEFTIAWDESGVFTAKGLWNDGGTSQIEDYRLCNGWKKYRRSCAVVYQGTSEGKALADVYTLVQRSGAYPFSIVSQ